MVRVYSCVSYKSSFCSLANDLVEHDRCGTGYIKGAGSTVRVHGDRSQYVALFLINAAETLCFVADHKHCGLSEVYVKKLGFIVCGRAYNLEARVFSAEIVDQLEYGIVICNTDCRYTEKRTHCGGNNIGIIKINGMSCDDETIHTECVTGAKNRAEITVVGRAIKQSDKRRFRKLDAGEIVVFHDDTTDRMCGVSGRIEDMTLSELKELSLGGTDEKIPTLKECLDA